MEGKSLYQSGRIHQIPIERIVPNPRQPRKTFEEQALRELADSIRQAAQTGTERVEIRLTPANLGAVTIEMTKDASGALQVVLHAANSRAAGLLQQHLDGLHTALQSYGAGQEVHVEVQRNQDSQQQHFQQADPDGRGQQQRQRQQEERQDNPSDGQDFIQKLRLGLFGTEETI